MDNNLQSLVMSIAQALVDHPDQILVREIGLNNTKILELEVAKDDVGKVIGRQGRTAQAMRTILSAVSAKENKKTVLEIIE
jgi:uncharacterized protein